MPAYKDLPHGDSEAASYQPPSWHQSADSSLRLVWQLIRNKDFYQLNQRTGLPKRRLTGSGPKPEAAVPVTIELDAQERLMQIDALLASKFAVPRGYDAEIRRNRELSFATGRLLADDEIYEGKTAKLETDIGELLKIGKRAHAGVPAQANWRGPSVAAIGLPLDRKYKNKVLTGQGVVVGIIDDGCALARWNFIRKKGNLSSRIRYLWDPAATGARAGWSTPKDATGAVDFPGLELTDAAIDAVLNANKTGDVIAEDSVYQAIQYRPGSIATHGTHVMDIATGNGNSLLGPEGVACDADIIFVQLPPTAIESGAIALEQSVIAGATYIFRRAEMLGKPAVINISYGGYDGPHDGTSAVERALDALLNVPNREIVVSAGNGFEARCHTSGNVQKNAGWHMRWIVPPVDPTPNDMEIWYPGKTNLEVRVQSPGPAITPSGWIPLNYPMTPIRRAADNLIIGYIEHLTSSTPNGDNMIFISLRPTDGASTEPGSAPAPSGTWRIELRNPGNKDATFHAWIRRDDSGRPASAYRRQSRFHSGDASPRHTVTGWACGNRTISVGGFNASTQEVAGYSACGPTRPRNRRAGDPKPDVYAPADETARHRGVLSASSLSGLPTRMNGTSASAPHVTGLIALMFEYQASLGRQGGGGLKAADIRDALVTQADTGLLKEDRHQIVDARVPIKQRAVWGDLVPSGNVNFLAAMRKLFP